MITNADVPLIRGLLCYLFTWPFYILRGLFYLHHGAVFCKLFLVNLPHVMHDLMSTYNYLISSCAYPRWAWHNFSGCTNTNRSVNPAFLCCVVLLAYYRCSVAWFTLAPTTLICNGRLTSRAIRLHADYPQTASVYYEYINTNTTLHLKITLGKTF